MNRTPALQKMMKWDKQGRYVFTLADLTKIFAEDSPEALQPFAAQVEARRAGIALIGGIADGVTAFGFGEWVSLGRDRSHKGRLR